MSPADRRWRPRWDSDSDDWDTRQYVPMDIDDFDPRYYAQLSEVNSASLSSRLPPELLSRIFWEVVRVVGPPRHTKQVLAIARVCSHWRTVALHYQSLWTCVYIPCHPGYLEAALQRSGQASLEVFIPSVAQDEGRLTPWSDSFRVNNTERVIQEAHRIHHLEITHNKVLLKLNNLAAFLGASWQLRSLQLAIDPTSGTTSGIIRSVLRSPDLKRCRIDSVLRPWPKLASVGKIEALTLSGYSSSLSEVQDSLRNMQHLHFLHLWLLGPISPNNATLHLPALEQLTLRGSGVACLSLLQSLRLPKAKTILVREPTWERIPSAFEPVVTSAISGLISSDRFQSATFKASLRSVGQHLRMVFETQGFLVVLDVPYRRSFLDAVCDGMPCASVDLLSLDTISMSNRTAQYGTELDVVRKLPNLRVALVHSCEVQIISLFLYELKVASLERGPNSANKLEVVGINASKPRATLPWNASISDVGIKWAGKDVMKIGNGQPAFLIKSWKEMKTEDLDGLRAMIRRIWSPQS